MHAHCRTSRLRDSGRDKYDDDGGASCGKLAGLLPPDKRRQVQLIHYPDATHVWETPAATIAQDPASHRGNGGSVRYAPNAVVYARARASTLEFFKSAFGM